MDGIGAAGGSKGSAGNAGVATCGKGEAGITGAGPLAMIGIAWVTAVLINGSACAPIPFAIVNAEPAAFGIIAVAAVAAFAASGAAMAIAFGINAASAGSASAPMGSPNPLYMIRAGTTSAPA